MTTKLKTKPETGSLEDTPFYLNSGLPFSFQDILHNRITLTDIAAHLSKLCRFAGATRVFYSVAQHAIHVAQIVARREGPLAGLYALHHDSHEAIMGDWPTPLKEHVFALTGFDINERVADQIDELIYTTFNLPYPVPAHIAKAIKTADQEMFVLEAQQLMRGWAPAVKNMSVGEAFKITPFDPLKAEREFISYHTRLMSEKGRHR